MTFAFYPHEIDVHPDKDKILATIEEIQTLVHDEVETIQEKLDEAVDDYEGVVENIRGLEEEFDLLDEIIGDFMNTEERSIMKDVIQKQVDYIRLRLGVFSDYHNLGKED